MARLAARTVKAMNESAFIFGYLAGFCAAWLVILSARLARRYYEEVGRE